MSILKGFCIKWHAGNGLTLHTNHEVIILKEIHI